MPKKRNLWIFGSWFGDKYCDSPKYLFEYVNKMHPEIRCVWLCTNQETVDLVRESGFEAHLTYGLKGYILSSSAIVSVISTGFNDVNRYIPAKYVINTWHGIPLKKILYDDKINNTHKETVRSVLLRGIFPFRKQISESYIVLASSEVEKANLCSAFNKSLDSISICGLPRNDIFFGRRKPNIRTKIIYMPTHRSEGKYDVSKLFQSELSCVNNKLHQLNIDLYVKLHFYHSNSTQQSEWSNVHFISDNEINQDIYSVLNSFDMLITDYSSVYFDFLLSDRPIIFAPFDLDDYLNADRELYFDYNAVTPGPKCRNWQEVLEWIEIFNDNVELYAAERKNIKNMFHSFQDGKSSERVCEEIFRLTMNSH